ncbi:Hypothetical predicted protein [Cloeon dipterum]|uniref:Gustatory receptor n=1 Tax=Cloeon dipterum TaxID=197152 RepID=A0A8S1CIL5_9INSE|nr:Hypothetical predicted protein [Cloeon dipterum]
MSFACVMMSRSFNTGFTITDLWIALGVVNEGIVFYWLVFIAQYMKQFVKIEAQEYTLLLEFNEYGKNEQNLNSLLLKHRRIWLEMLSLMRRAGNTMSMCVGSLMLVNFGRSLYALFMMFTNQIALILFLFLIYALCPIVVECHYCHSVTQEVSDSITEAIKVTKALKISRNRKMEMIGFFGRLANLIRPISFNYYMECDRKMLTTVLAALLTNAVIIVQLNVGEQDFNLDDYNTICELIHHQIVLAFI